jgi:hypothetical protein
MLSHNRFCSRQRLPSLHSRPAVTQQLALRLRPLCHPQALLHLASDAVRAAAESPFLDGALSGATGLLCCLSLPPAAAADPRGVRLAAQAAAGALRALCGPCSIVLSAEPRQLGGSCGGTVDTSGTLAVEATLLVLRGGAERGQLAAPLPAGAAAWRTAARQQRAPGPGGPPRQQLQQQQQQQRARQRLPASSWGLLSAMAGGTPAATPAASSKPPAGAAAAAAAPTAARGDPAAAAAGRVQVARPERLQRLNGQPAGGSSPGPQQQAEEQQQGSAQASGDALLAALTAQSLDLPPAVSRRRSASPTSLLPPSRNAPLPACLSAARRHTLPCHRHWPRRRPQLPCLRTRR